MLLQRLPYLLVYFSALSLSVVVFYYARRNKSVAGVKLFGWSILLEITWLIGYLIEIYSSSIDVKIFWDNFQYIGNLLAPIFMVGFAVEFTDVKINARRLIAFLSIIPILFLLAIFSYQIPDLIRVNPYIELGLPFDELSYGLGTLVKIVYGYLYLVALGYIGVLVAAFFRQINVTRSQVILVLVGTLIPIVGLLGGLIFGWEFANQRDIGPLMFALSNGVIAIGIFQFRLFNVIPIARQALFETLDDVLIVLDGEDRIIDINPGALKAFGWQYDQVRDVSIEKLLPELYYQFKDISDVRTTISLENNLHFDLRITPIYDRAGALFGRLISAHDMTSQKRIEQDLQRSNEQNRKRAAQFQAVAQVASSITSVQELQQMLTQITSTISLQLGHYHVAIFLLDSQFQFAILEAANSEGGQEMLTHEYRLKIDGSNAVSTAITTGKPQLVSDVENSNVFHSNPYLPNTRSEAAIPIRLGRDLIGVLDIQSLEEKEFTTDDLEVFKVLASQVGTAIQNARLYEQNVQSLKEVQDAYRRLSTHTWDSLLKQVDTRAYAYDGVSSRPVTEIQPALKTTTLSVPVTVRGKVVGNLRLNPLDPNRTWTDDEIAITEAVAERAALALEGARLLEDAQKRASRESFLSDVAAKLSTSFQLDSILRDTVEELGQTLSGSTISFQLINPSAPPNGQESNNGNGSSPSKRSE